MLVDKRSTVLYNIRIVNRIQEERKGTDVLFLSFTRGQTIKNVEIATSVQSIFCFNKR